MGTESKVLPLLRELEALLAALQEAERSLRAVRKKLVREALADGERMEDVADALRVTRQRVGQLVREALRVEQ